MSVTVTDHRAAAEARYDEAARLGMAAVANLLTREIKQAFGTDYYTGGKYRDTVKIKASIRYLQPYKTPDGWETQVGTNKIIALYWELGWSPKGSSKRFRVPIWAPTAAAQIEPMRNAFARVVARVMGRP